MLATSSGLLNRARIGGRNFGVLLGLLPIEQFLPSVLLEPRKNGLVCSVLEATFDPVEFWRSIPPSQVQ